MIIAFLETGFPCAVVPLLTALVWPLTLLLILFCFRKTIETLLKTVAEAKIGDSLVFKFWEAKTDLTSVSPTLTGTPPAGVAVASDTPRWERVANLFWLGSDLDWTVQTVLRGAPKERIIHGLTQAYHHASECGLESTAPGKQIAAIKTRVEQIPESVMGREWRANFVEQLHDVIQGFSGLARQRQPDFRPNP